MQIKHRATTDDYGQKYFSNKSIELIFGLDGQHFPISHPLDVGVI